MKGKYIKAEDEYVDKTLEYVNTHYNRNLKSGQTVTTFNGKGIVVGGTCYVFIKRNGKIESYHPQDIKE
jgi:hypothetical protein